MCMPFEHQKRMCDTLQQTTPAYTEHTHSHTHTYIHTLTYTQTHIRTHSYTHTHIRVHTSPLPKVPGLHVHAVCIPFTVAFSEHIVHSGCPADDVIVLPVQAATKTYTRHTDTDREIHTINTT